jgi:hypothetical protein
MRCELTFNILALNSSAVRGLLLGNLFWAIAANLLGFIPFHFSHNGNLLYVLNRAHNHFRIYLNLQYGARLREF